jgi:hypothetical protein
MPITNNLITINGDALRPAPKFSIAYETFKSGDYIIGGIAKVSISGELYAVSDIDLSTKINDISSYSGTCQTLLIQCDGSILINGTAFIRSISFNPTNQPFSVTYTIEVEVSDTSSTLSVKRDIDFTTLYDINIPDDIILKSYEESLLLSSDESLTQTSIYADGSYTKASLKLSGQISIETYHHMCDNFGSPDLTSKIYNIINSRIQKLLSLDPILVNAYPSLSPYLNGNYTAINDNKNISFNKFNNKIDFKFDLFIIAGDCHPQGIVDLTITENTDQNTGMSTWNLRGSIKGLANITTNAVDNTVISDTKLTNARLIYNDLENKTQNPEYRHFTIFGCKDAASAPSNICYGRMSSQITENFNLGQIEFEMTYGDVESCQVGGSTIDVNIQIEYPTRKYIEHIVPGRGSALIQIYDNLTPTKVTVTASGRINGCDTSLINDLKTCVTNRFNDATDPYLGYLVTKQTETTGKYSYKKSISYIACS